MAARPDAEGALLQLVNDRELMGQFMRKPGFLLARVDQICTAIFGTLSGTTTLSQVELLLLLDRLGPMIQITLARAAGVDKSTTAYIVDNLQARGWVERTVPENDRRSQLVSLTEEGRRVLPLVKRDFAALQQQLKAPFALHESALLISRLHRLGQHSEASAPPWRSACEPATGVLDFAISFLARRALQLLHAQFTAKTRGTRLTLRQFSLLFILSRREAITQVEFARIFGLDPATCAVIMRGPARRGLIDSARCPHDGRARTYRLTQAGRTLLGEVHPLVDESEAAVFGHLSAEERERIVEWLQRIVRSYSELLRYPGAIGCG